MFYGQRTISSFSQLDINTHPILAIASLKNPAIPKYLSFRLKTTFNRKSLSRKVLSTPELKRTIPCRNPVPSRVLIEIGSAIAKGPIAESRVRVWRVVGQVVHSLRILAGH